MSLLGKENKTVQARWQEGHMGARGDAAPPPSVQGCDCTSPDLWVVLLSLGSDIPAM